MTQNENLIAIAKAERFMAKVEKTDSCWLWTGIKSGSGYGQFWENGKRIPAHWFLLEQRPPKGMMACHTCDNRLCVRPSHIFIGTASDNMQDAVRKGRLKPLNGCLAMLKVRRIRHGEDKRGAKLTTIQALEAKNCPHVWGAAIALARKFGVNVCVIYEIRSGKRWAHL